MFYGITRGMTQPDVSNRRSRDRSQDDEAPAWARWMGVALLGLVALLAIEMPAPPDVPAQAAPEEFSATRALAAASPLLSHPRAIGTPEHAAAAATLRELLTSLGLEVDVQDSSACSESARRFACAHVHNIIGKLRGRSGERALALVAHYDSVSHAPGAGDDGSGVATLLETARALRAGRELANDVLFIFTDAEEDGLLGAVAFVRDHPWHRAVRLVLNFDARGSRGVATMHSAPADNGVIVRALNAASTRPVSSSFILSLVRVLPNATDAMIFESQGDTTLGFENYHRNTDTLANLDARSVQHDGDYALGLTRYFASGDLGALRGPPLVYFDLFARALIAYSRATGIGLTAAGVLLYFLALMRGRRQGIVGLAGVGAGLLWSWLALVCAVASSAALGRLVARVVRTPELVAHPGLAVAPHIALGAAVILGVYARAARRNAALSLALGAVATWLLAALATAVWSPGPSYLFHIPLFFAALGLFVATLRISPHARAGWAALGAVPGAYFLSVLVWETLVSMGGSAPTIPATCADLLVVLVVWTLGLRMANARFAASLALAACLLAGGGALWMRHDARLPYFDDLGYLVDADGHRAQWVSRDIAPDAATRPLLGAQSTRGDDGLLYADAPLFAAPAPALAFVRDERRGTIRDVTLRVRSPRGARCVRVYETSGTSIRSTRVDGALPHPIFQFSLEKDRRLAHTFYGWPASPPWDVEMCAAGREGFVLEIEVDVGARPHFVVMDRSPGLPPEGPQLTRPADFLPAQDSDQTFVMKGFDLPGLDQ
jgi:hypothetical protein